MRISLERMILSILLLSATALPPRGSEAAWGLRTEPAPPGGQITAAAATGVTPRAHYVIRGGYVAAGVGMRNLGSGNITISGIPSKSKVVRAFLYWDILNSGDSPLLSMGNFNGKAIQGALVGSGGDPCWIGGSNFAYRADVTSLVKGNGVYHLTGFASGDTSGASPFSSTPVFPLLEGATLVVIYSNNSMPAVDIVLVEGSDLVVGPYSLTVDGFQASNPVTFAQYTSFGADGQHVGTCAIGEQTFFNGSLISTSDWDGADGPNQMWDTHTHDVTALIAPGATSASIYYPGNTCDCLVWVGAIVAVSAADTDGDGLPDAWEKHGYTDPETNKFVDLPGMGAKYDHKDVFVEVDYMVAGDHTHKPLKKAIDGVVKAFKNAPVLNPDGKTGIKLHVDYGQGGLLKGGNSLPEQALLPGVISGDWSAFDVIKNANFAPERRPIFHYAIFAHNIHPNGTSGISRGIPASDFIVSLGAWTNQVGTLQEQAGTFMHELGHNINLRHGGSDHVNYKANFLSVMNYFFQTRGLRKNKKDGLLDYSRFLLPALNETSLDETKGLNGGKPIKSYGTRYACIFGS